VNLPVPGPRRIPGCVANREPAVTGAREAAQPQANELLKGPSYRRIGYPGSRRVRRSRRIL